MNSTGQSKREKRIWTETIILISETGRNMTNICRGAKEIFIIYSKVKCTYKRWKGSQTENCGNNLGSFHLINSNSTPHRLCFDFIDIIKQNIVFFYNSLVLKSPLILLAYFVDLFDSAFLFTPCI